jgi:hypothetical protein
MASTTRKQLSGKGVVVVSGATVLAAAGAVLFSVAAGIEGIASASKTVNVSVSSTGNGSAAASVKCGVAQVGVFTSTYEPECAQLPGVRESVATTALWPLFPAQTSFGGGSVAEARLVGLGSTPFTTCDAYMPLSVEQVMTGTVNVIDDKLGETLVSLYAGFNGALAQYFEPALVGVFNYSAPASNFQANDFAAISANISANAPYLADWNALIVEECAGVSSVVTLADCKSAVLAQAQLPLGPGARNLSSPVGSVFANSSEMLDGTLSAFTDWSATLPEQEQDKLSPYAMQMLVLYMLNNACVGFNATDAASCGALAAIPSNASAPYVLASLFGSAGNFNDFVLQVSQMASMLPPDMQAVLPAISAVIACQARNETDPRVCLATSVGFGAAVQVFNMLYPRLNFAVQPSWINGTAAPPVALFVAQVTEQCALGDEDIKLITRSQRLLIATLFFAWAGVVAAVASAVLRRAFLPALPGSFLILAAVLAIVSLTGLYGAPIYKIVGATCVEGSVCYAQGAAVPVGLAAVTASLVSGVALCGAALLRTAATGEPELELKEPVDAAPQQQQV